MFHVAVMGVALCAFGCMLRHVWYKNNLIHVDAQDKQDEEQGRPKVD